MIKVHDLYHTYDVPKDSLSFRPAVYGVIMRDDMVLLMPLKDKFWFPGGGVELGETHLDTLRREIMEETGMAVRPVKILNVYSSMYHDFKTDNNYHSIQIYYVCEIVQENGTPAFTDDEQQYLKPAVWAKISELNKYPFAGIEPVYEDILNIVKKC